MIQAQIYCYGIEFSLPYVSYLSQQIVLANCLFHITDLISVATFIPSEMALRQYRSCFLRTKKIKYRKTRLKRMDNISFPFLVHYAVLSIYEKETIRTAH